MILTTEQILLLNRCVAQGPIDKASVVIFGNEFGTAGGEGDTERCVKRFINEFKTRKLLQIGEGFSTIDIDPPPVNSTFLQFIARLMLALKYKDDRFFEELTPEGKIFLNNYIMNSLYREDTAIVNLKPYPQHTERHWDYSNIDEKVYYKQYNFMHRNHLSDQYKEIRIKAMKEAFDLAKTALIIGSGDKENKRAFLQTIYPEIEFAEYKLNETAKIYFSRYPKIILSNYYDHRSGIRLSGLKSIYEFIVKSNLL